MPLPPWANATNLGIVTGVIFGIAHVVQLYIPKNTLAWRIADKVLAIGPNIFDLLGTSHSTPDLPPAK